VRVSADHNDRAHPEPLTAGPASPVEVTTPGLRKFDLGTIPAPVTPPRSWRRAAWFAIGASLAVVAGLIFATSALVGQPRDPGTIDALPNYPSLPKIFLDPPNSAVSDPAGPTSGRQPSQSGQPGQPGQLSSLMSSTTQLVPASSSGPQPTASSSPSATSTPQSPAPLAPPVRETTPPRVFASNDPEEIGDRTEAFYKRVTTDPDAAYGMTTGEMYLQGKESFKQRYADIERVEVKRMGIDPNQGTTTSEVRITKRDGSTITERRVLEFTSGSNPRISSEVTH
jgi:hypothetical protein